MRLLVREPQECFEVKVMSFIFLFLSSSFESVSHLQSLRIIIFTSPPMLKTQILDYQHEILSNNQIRKPEIPTTSDPDTFQQWNLNQLIKEVLANAPSEQIQVRWIGNHPSSSVLAFFYCVFKVCASYQIMVVKLKYSMYRISQYHLSLSQQKALIQFLSLLYEDIDLSAFFIQNRSIQKILIKIYQALGGYKYTRNPQTLCQFCTNIFDFMQMDSLSEISENVFSVSLSSSLSLKSEVSNMTCQVSNPINHHKTMYIIRQKSCYFVCQYIPAFVPNSYLNTSQNRDSSVIQEESFNESAGKIPSFLVSKKQIKSQRKILNNFFERHEPPINAPYTTSINQSKATITEKIKEIISNSPLNRNSLRNTLNQLNTKDLIQSIQTETKIKQNKRKEGYSKSPQKIPSPRYHLNLKQYLSCGVSPANENSGQKIDLNYLNHKINKVYSQRNIYALNSARSDSKSSKNVCHQKQTSRNNSMEKDHLSVLVTNNANHSPRKQSEIGNKELKFGSQRVNIQMKKKGGDKEKSRNYPTFTAPQVYLNGIQPVGKGKGLNIRLRQQLRSI